MRQLTDPFRVGVCRIWKIDVAAWCPFLVGLEIMEIGAIVNYRFLIFEFIFAA